jgi:large subunit ribosomal protein L20
MARVKRGTTSMKRRRKVLKAAKGFRGDRSKKERAAKEALIHAWSHAYRDRRKKKSEFRKLWQIKINAGARKSGLSYSQFINHLKKSKVKLDRKILADLAEKHPETFVKVIEEVKK